MTNIADSGMKKAGLVYEADTQPPWEQNTKAYCLHSLFKDAFGKKMSVFIKSEQLHLV